MEKEHIAEMVKRAGEAAQNSDSKEFQTSLMQVKMLGEIAYQLAVMNERAAQEKESLRDRVEGHSVMIEAIEKQLPPVKSPEICGKYLGVDSSTGYMICGFLKGHDGPHARQV